MTRRSIRLDAAFSEPMRAVGYNVDSRRIPIDTPLRFGLYLEAERTDHRQLPDLHAPGRRRWDARLLRPITLPVRIRIRPHCGGPAICFTIVLKFQLPAGTPPGEYQVVVGLYDERGRLKLSDGRDHIESVHVTLTP